MDSIAHLVRSNVPSVAPGDRLPRVAQVLARLRCNAALVVEDERLVGCVMRRLLLRPLLSPETKAERLASRPPIARCQTTMQDAIAMAVQSGLDLLPVAEKDKLKGAVLARDLALKDPRFLDLAVEDASDQLAPPLAETSSVSEAAAWLRDNDMESLPLVDARGALSGCISFADIHRYLLAPARGLRRTGQLVGEKEHPLRNPVASLARRSSIVVSPDTGLRDALATLCEKQSNELTVVDGDRVRGHLNVIRILRVKVPSPGLILQTVGLEGEDRLVVSQILENLRATALKIKRICRNVGTPELKVKSYKHIGSTRKRYEVKVIFSVPEQFAAEAQGWNLLVVAKKAIRAAENEILRERSRIIDSQRRRGVSRMGEAD